MFSLRLLRALRPAELTALILVLIALLAPVKAISVSLLHHSPKDTTNSNILHTPLVHSFIQKEGPAEKQDDAVKGKLVDVKNLLIHQHNEEKRKANAADHQPLQRLKDRISHLSVAGSAPLKNPGSVTSTNTPSAFTQKDPFEHFAAAQKQRQREYIYPGTAEPKAELHSEAAMDEKEASKALEDTVAAKVQLEKEFEQNEDAKESAPIPKKESVDTEERKNTVPSGEKHSEVELPQHQTLEEKLYKTMPNAKLSDKDVTEFVDTKVYSECEMILGVVPLLYLEPVEGNLKTNVTRKYACFVAAVASNVRRLIGIKAGANMHLEKQQLIKPGCDVATFGPVYCANPDNPDALKILWSLEHRKNSVYFYLAVLMLACGVILQLVFRLLENIVLKGGNLFSKELMEAAFRQIAYITIADVILWGIMQSNLSSVMDQLVFGDVLPERRDADKILENVSPMLEVLFEEFFFVAVLLLIWYVVYVVYIYFTVRRLSAWVTRVDEETDIMEIAEKATAARSSFWKRIFKRNDIEKANYVAHRYDFADEVKATSMPGIDTSGYYFTEYMKASLMKTAVEMVRLPNTTLIFLMVVAAILRPFFSLRLQYEAALLCSCSVASFLLLMVAHGTASAVKRQLLPKHVARYIYLHYELESGEDVAEEASEYLIPRYKLQQQKGAWPGLFSRFFYGTTLPNKHQQLFCCWANGPSILLRLLEASCFCQLLVLAWWIQLLRTHPTNWLEMSWWGSVGVCCCALLHFICFRPALYSVLIAVKGGMLIDWPVLKRVWEVERSGSIRRVAELVEAFRIHSMLFEIQRGGPIWWRQMQIQISQLSQKETQDMRSLWASLADEQKGTVEKNKLFQFLESEGVVHDEYSLEDFLRVFDQTQKGCLDEAEFYALVHTLRKSQLEPLDENRLRLLFEEKYGIPWDAATGVDYPSFSRIISEEFRLQWSEGQRRHFLDSIAERQTPGISPEVFCSQLQFLEKQTLQPLQEGNSPQGVLGKRMG